MDARPTIDSPTDSPAASPSVSVAAHTAIAIIAIAWCAALTWLVLATANPVTLNRRQILDADAVVTAQLVDPATGTCRIVRQWNGPMLPNEIVVAYLDETAVRAGGDWILPLVKIGDQPEVLASSLRSHARFVYPATPEVLEQLDAILNPLVRPCLKPRSGDTI
ncbi:MAG: hypothetical protein JNG89_17635 [Planctomycetaceae bacterium]|nr:hypothetical protein [Planctomycetaceae bacterium]